MHDKLKNLPALPGVYIMKNGQGTVIYVGKAKSLKNRVRQYFQEGAEHSPKTALMVAKVADFEYVITDSETEALVLECNLIKEYMPRYNILLKDDKNYPYIKLTMQEEYPRILFTRRIERDGALYFGPYPSSPLLREIIDMVKKAFRIPHCSRRFPRDARKDRPCIYYQIKQCCAPCQGTVSSAEYRALFEEIAAFLRGNQQGLIERFTREMTEASDKLDFERAAALHGKIKSVQQIMERQKVVSAKRTDEDVIALVVEADIVVFEVFCIRDGRLLGHDSHCYSGKGGIDEHSLMSDFVKQLYNRDTILPKSILLSGDIDAEDNQLLEDWLSERRGARVFVKNPKRGESKALVDMAKKNALQSLAGYKLKLLEEQSKGEALEELEKQLGLNRPPRRIEAYDISNTSGAMNVGSMVVFEGGKPAPREYRKFKIKYIQGADDYACMKEMLARRMNRAAQGDEKFDTLPDLMLIDGGKGHACAALEVVRSFDPDFPVFGMVKDDKHRTRGLVGTEGEVGIKPGSAAFRLITYIQEEVHRTAISYHRALRGKSAITSQLEGIPGVGEGRRKSLMRHFKSIANIRKASVEELGAVPGISEKIARNIFDYFR